MASQTLDKIYYVTLLQHGESVCNAEGYHQGQSDFDLTTKGKEQVIAVAQRWHTEVVTSDRGISSPLP